MAIEQYTESMTLQNMKCVLGENDFGYVFPQGDVADVSKVERLLKKAGGNPRNVPCLTIRWVVPVRQSQNTLLLSKMM